MSIAGKVARSRVPTDSFRRTLKLSWIQMQLALKAIRREPQVLFFLVLFPLMLFIIFGSVFPWTIEGTTVKLSLSASLTDSNSADDGESVTGKSLQKLPPVYGSKVACATTTLFAAMSTLVWSFSSTLHSNGTCCM